MIVASERLSPVVEDWLEVPVNHVLQASVPVPPTVVPPTLACCTHALRVCFAVDSSQHERAVDPAVRGSDADAVTQVPARRVSLHRDRHAQEVQGC